MRFRKGIHYPHPPRGRARMPYLVSEAARRQRLANLKGTRLRSDRESLIIKLLIWQSFFEPEPRPTQRALAQQFGVWWSYVAKVMGAAMSEGMGASLQYGRVSLSDFADAQGFTAKLRAQEPGLLAPLPAPAQPREDHPCGVEQAVPNVPLSNPYRVMAHAKTLREWQELERRGGRRRVMSSVPVRSW